MIYNRDESEVAVLGEVQKYKVGIDERNINHIVTILSSNLYSHPMTSFLREIVSNAVDSHVEAKTDEPIIIHRTDNAFSIRDYGTGISPERFEEIYLNIGSSTKRQSNDYIGSFGIGRFSALAVTDLCNITSYYEGKAYYYVMNKDIDQLHIDLLDVLPTEEHNGVEVKIPLKYWDPKFLDCLAFIDNIYVESDVHNDLCTVECFNKRKIYSFNNFKVLSSTATFKDYEETEILLGKIPYTVNYNELWDYNDSWHRSWKECFKWVYPQIEIGQIDITPNRESLLYSERTKEVLCKAYDACINELVDIWNKACDKEFDDIWEYTQRITSHADNRLELPDTNNIIIPVSNELHYKVTYKKHKEWDNIPIKQKETLIRALYNKQIDVLAKLCGSTLHQGKRQERWFDVRRLFEHWICCNYGEGRKVIALPSKSGFSSQYFKNYVLDTYGDIDILFIRKLPKHLTISNIRFIIRSIWSITIFSNPQELHFAIQLLREVLLYLNRNITVTDIMSSSEYEKYKKEHTVKKNRISVPTEKICFTVNICDSSNCPEKVTMKLNEIISYCKSVKKKCHIVTADLENPFIWAFKNMRYPNLVILSAAKNKMPMLYANLPKWVKPIESLYNKDNRILQKFAATEYIFSQSNIILNGHDSFPEPYRNSIEKLKELVAPYLYWKNNYNELSSVRAIIETIPFEKYDNELMALWNICKPWAELSYKLKTKVNSGYNSNTYFCYYILLKNKKYRMDWQFYHDVRDSINNLLNEI